MDKRNARRIKVSIDADVLNESDRSLLAKAKILELSIIGIGLETGCDLMVGQKYIFVLMLPGIMQTDKARIEILGEAKSSRLDRTNLYGIKFINISPLDKSKLSYFIERSMADIKYMVE